MQHRLDRLMLIISKKFTIVCLLCLCGNREYPGSFQNKSVSSSFKWSTQVYSAPGKTERRRKAFLVWTTIDLSSNILLHVGIMLTITKFSSSYSYSECVNREHPGNF